jgi:hypothetical protein
MFRLFMLHHSISQRNSSLRQFASPDFACLISSAEGSIIDRFCGIRFIATSLHRNLAAPLVQSLQRKNICRNHLFSSAISCATITPVH